MRYSVLLLVCQLTVVAWAGDQTAAPASEPWAAKPFPDWPQLVLTNHASFRGHTPLEGASAFLIQTPQGTVLAATAKHLLGENGGVEPEVKTSELDQVLQSWTLNPRPSLKQQISVGGLGPIETAVKNNDWLLLRLSGSGGERPSSPLRLRSTPVAVGETVHLIGVSYAEPAVAQKIYSGKVTQRRYGDRFRFDIDVPVDLRGFSGAPIVDDAGAVVGVLSIWFNDAQMKGAMWLEAGGEDAQSALNILKE